MPSFTLLTGFTFYSFHIVTYIKEEHAHSKSFSHKLGGPAVVENEINSKMWHVKYKPVDGSLSICIYITTKALNDSVNCTNSDRSRM